MEDKIITEKEYERNPLLNQLVKATDEDSEFKNFIVDFTGKEHQPEDDNVTVEMILETLAKNFPEVVFAVAEENFLRGYEQALEDKRAFSENVSE